LALAFVVGFGTSGVRPATVDAKVDGSRLENVAGGGAALDKHSKMDSHLAGALRLHRAGTRAAARQALVAQQARVADDLVEVEIVAREGRADEVAHAVMTAGGQVVARFQTLVLAWVAVDALESIANAPSVAFVRVPTRDHPDAVEGQEVVRSGARTWHVDGKRGAGAKVAVIDLGFSGLAAAQAAGDLPNSVTTQDFCSGNFDTATNHGTAVAEVVHEMAPAADLFLLCYSTFTQLGQALEYAKTNGIQVINRSVSSFNAGRGDGATFGTGRLDSIVLDARTNGILWVNAAGNYRRTHWSGTFTDTDDDNVHNFDTSDEGNTFSLANNARTCAYLKWDNWPTSSNDFDLELRESGPNTLIAQSTNTQSGTQSPTESVCHTNSTGSAKNYFLLIRRINAAQSPQFDLFVTGTADLEYQVEHSSVTDPGASPNVIAVGAVCHTSEVVESFSSRGSTIDGRVKPDLVAHTDVSNFTFGTTSDCTSTSGFDGTSPSSAAVAGAAAVVKGHFPSMTVERLQTLLEGRARPAGAGGKDNAYGSGVLAMGLVPRPKVPLHRQFAGPYNVLTGAASAATSPDRRIDHPVTETPADRPSRRS
jgi:hypothetical protein